MLVFGWRHLDLLDQPRISMSLDQIFSSPTGVYDWFAKVATY